MAAIAQLTLTIVDVTPKTRWTFVEVGDTDGRFGTGEASLLGREAALVAAFDHLAPMFKGAAARPFTDDDIPSDIAMAAIRSAIDQALWDLEGQRRGVALADLLGRRRADVAVYANINRRTVSRTPEAFADSARHAMAAGFLAVKMAPFDEVRPDIASLDTAAPGLARVRAVRRALPGHVGVYVDCHWRFTPAVAVDMIAALADAGACWYECPIDETDDAGPVLAELRRLAAARGVILAGREEGVTRRPFEIYAEAGAYDVMMPDVKYIGSLAEMMATAAMLARHGIRFSPHNHTGPIGHVASLAVALAAEGCDLLEMQFDETENFERLVEGDLPRPAGGQLAGSPRPGLGLRLAPTVLDALASVRRVVR